MYSVLHCLSTRPAVLASALRLFSLLRVQQRPCLHQTSPVPACFLTPIHVSVRCASRKASASSSASTTAKTRKRKSKQPAAHRAHANAVNASASPSPHTISHEAAVVHADATIEENDVRMAMRFLMSQHLSNRYYTKVQRTDSLEKEREVLREKHEERERRLMMKDESSRRLLGKDARAIGDGVVPLMPTESKNPYNDVAGGKPGAMSSGGAGGGAPAAAWRMLNPVGLAASQAAAAAAATAVSQGLTTDGAKSENTPLNNDDRLSEEDYASFLAGPAASAATGHASAGHAELQADLDGWKSATLATLCAPNLSVYDADRDFRLNSEEVVRQSQQSSVGLHKGRQRAATAITTAAAAGTTAQNASAVPFTFKEDDSIDDLNADLPPNAAVQLKQEFAEADDPDYTVALYTEEDDDSDSAGPFQL